MYAERRGLLPRPRPGGKLKIGGAGSAPHSAGTSRTAGQRLRLSATLLAGTRRSPLASVERAQTARSRVATTHHPRRPDPGPTPPPTPGNSGGAASSISGRAADRRQHPRSPAPASASARHRLKRSQVDEVNRIVPRPRSATAARWPGARAGARPGRWSDAKALKPPGRKRGVFGLMRRATCPASCWRHLQPFRGCGWQRDHPAHVITAADEQEVADLDRLRTSQLEKRRAGRTATGPTWWWREGIASRRQTLGHLGAP